MSVKSSEIQNYLVNTLQNELNWNYNGVWIGASDLSFEGTWTWTDGKSSSYTHSFGFLYTMFNLFYTIIAHATINIA